MKKTILSSIIVLFLISNVYSMDITLPVLRKGSDLDRYAYDLIIMLLKKTGEDVNMSHLKNVANQSRKVALMKKGKLDIDWYGVDQKLEKELIPIRFPIFKGLLGHRIFITNKKFAENEIPKIKTKQDLAKHVMLQGRGWGDVAVLRAGGFEVKEVGSYETIFKWTNMGREGHLFPRAVVEPYGELEARKANLTNLVIDDQIMVIYKFGMFFFVSPKNPKLAKILNDNFSKAQEDGSFDNYFANSDYIKSVLKQSEMATRKHIFRIDNPNLSSETNSIPSKYWLDLKKVADIIK